LRTFCELVNSTISDSFIQFYSYQYVSASVKPSKLFESETTSLIDQFKSSMINSFLLSLSMIRNTTYANALFSGLFTNYQISVVLDNYGILMYSQTYNGCKCVYTPTCIDQSSIFEHSNRTRSFNVTGFYTGCYVIESLLQSNLECFYNQQCIDHLRVYIAPSWSMKNVTALDSSLPSNYSKTSTIKDLVDSLMIETWKPSTMYDRYYNECQPTQCTYSVETRNDAIYIITTLFGIVGGLITVLKLIVPRLVRILRKKKQLVPSTTGKSTSEIVMCMIFNFGVLRRNRSAFRLCLSSFEREFEALETY
jgi:hypothetical protein